MQFILIIFLSQGTYLIFFQDASRTGTRLGRFEFCSHKELVQNLVGSINSYSEKVDNYTQRVDKLIEQNGEMIKLLTQVIMKNNINDGDHNKDKKKEGVDDNNKEKKKDEIHDEEKQN